MGKLIILLFDIQRTKIAMDKKSTGKTTPKIEDRWSEVVCGKSLDRLALDAKWKYTWNLNSLSTIHYVKIRIPDFFCKEVLVKRGTHALTVTWVSETLQSSVIISICLIYVSHRVTQNGVNEICNFGRPFFISSLLYIHSCLSDLCSALEKILERNNAFSPLCCSFVYICESYSSLLPFPF